MRIMVIIIYSWLWKNLTMEMQQLRYFLAAVKHGNIGRAAKELNITQPALSRSIKNLETDLGAQLLERGPQGRKANRLRRQPYSLTQNS